LRFCPHFTFISYTSYVLL